MNKGIVAAMINGLRDRIRGARRVELFAALALAALLLLILLGQKSPQSEDGRTALEARLERVLSGIDGAGTVRAMVSEDEDGRAMGAVIVAPEAEDVRTYLGLQAAVSKLLALEVERIEIIGRGGRFGGTL